MNNDLIFSDEVQVGKFKRIDIIHKSTREEIGILHFNGKFWVFNPEFQGLVFDEMWQILKKLSELGEANIEYTTYCAPMIEAKGG